MTLTRNEQFAFALDTLTQAQAKAYAMDPEKWIHVTDNYLDVWGFQRTEKNVNRVEDRFEELLKGNK